MIKLTKDSKFDMFYDGDKYLDHKNLPLHELYKEIYDWLSISISHKTKIRSGFDIAWIKPGTEGRGKNRINFYNAIKLAKEYLNYIVCLPGEITREPFSKKLVGESSLLKEMYESDFILKQEKARNKFLNTYEGQMAYLRSFAMRLWKKTDDYARYCACNFAYSATNDKQYYCENFDTWLSKNIELATQLYEVKYDRTLDKIRERYDKK